MKHTYVRDFPDASRDVDRVRVFIEVGSAS